MTYKSEYNKLMTLSKQSLLNRVISSRAMLTIKPDDQPFRRPSRVVHTEATNTYHVVFAPNYRSPSPAPIIYWFGLGHEDFGKVYMDALGPDRSLSDVLQQRLQRFPISANPGRGYTQEVQVANGYPALTKHDLVTCILDHQSDLAELAPNANQEFGLLNPLTGRFMLADSLPLLPSEVVAIVRGAQDRHWPEIVRTRIAHPGLPVYAMDYNL